MIIYVLSGMFVMNSPALKRQNDCASHPIHIAAMCLKTQLCSSTLYTVLLLHEEFSEGPDSSVEVSHSLSERVQCDFEVYQIVRMGTMMKSGVEIAPTM